MDRALQQQKNTHTSILLLVLRTWTGREGNALQASDGVQLWQFNISNVVCISVSHEDDVSHFIVNKKLFFAFT